MAWGSILTLEDSTTVFTTEVFSTILSANPGESIFFQVQNAVSSTGANELTVNVYGCRSSATADSDSQPLFSRNLANTLVSNAMSFVVPDEVPFMRLGYITDGATDTHTVYAYAMKDGISV